MTYHFALCDDEIAHSDLLEEEITKILSDKGHIVTFDRYDSGLKLIETFEVKGRSYEIVFLDIQMSLLDGIETGKRIREFDKSVIIIYVSGYVDFAIRAFEIRAFDYILKPIDTIKLEKALDEAFVRIEAAQMPNIEEKKLLTLKYDKKIINIVMMDIIFLEKVANKVVFVCEDCRYEVYDSLLNIKNVLNEKMFLQTHQGYIVNMKKISRYENQKLVLNQGHIIPVSKKNIHKVKTAFFESLRS